MIHDMSDEKLNRLIAESIEEKPYFLPILGPLPTGFYSASGVVFSPGKTWRFSGYDGDWQCNCNFVTDPACMVILISLPGFVSLDQIVVGEYEAEFCGAKEHSEACGAEMQHASSDRPQRALAEAYALAFKLDLKDTA